MAHKAAKSDANTSAAASSSGATAGAATAGIDAAAAPGSPPRVARSYLFPDGARYTGECKTIDGKVMRDGLGEYACDTERYVGSWTKDAMDGPGKYFYSSGAVYDGMICNNQMHGEGTYRWPKEGDEPPLINPPTESPTHTATKVMYQATYVGGWQNNRMHGQGVYTDSAGVKWEGEFHNGTFRTGHSQVVLRK